MRRFRLILLAALSALAAAMFVLPIVRGDRCGDAGGRFDRATLTCHPR